MVTFGPVVSEEKSFESVDGRRTTDGQRRLTILYSGELKKDCLINTRVKGKNDVQLAVSTTRHSCNIVCPNFINREYNILIRND